MPISYWLMTSTRLVFTFGVSFTMDTEPEIQRYIPLTAHTTPDVAKEKT